MLNDVYSDACSEATMYAYASLGETKKRTLDNGDIAGIEAIYGQASQAASQATSQASITVTVIDSASGKAISGANVFVDGVWKGTTDGLGQLKMTRVYTWMGQGSHTITVTKTGYRSVRLVYTGANSSLVAAMEQA
jgi:hypothetical protein